MTDSKVIQSLQRLNQIVNNANEQRPQKSRHHDDIATGVVNTLSEITGDFKQTLLDCNAILNDNSKFKRSTANFVDNVAWHTSTEREVNSLRRRLRFHMMKVDFVAKPFEIQLLSGIRRELQQLRKEVAALKAVLDWDPTQNRSPIDLKTHESCSQVPKELSDRFDALVAKDQKLSHEQDGLPLKEGWDALVYHFARSTVNFAARTGLGQEVPEEQYLNLVKSRWILDRLREKTHILSPDADSLWAECMREVENKVEDQLLRFQQDDLLQPPLDVLTRLPDHYFSIWVDDEPSPRPVALTEHRFSEEKILELPLQSPHSTHQSTLTIFRKSDNQFRLVSATKDDQNQALDLQESVDVSMIHTGLVPVFTASQDRSIVNNNVLLCNQGQDTKGYNLCNQADTAQFQRALTGFRVSHDMSNISWHIEFDQFGKSGISGKARLQLWHLKPLRKLQQHRDDEPIETSSSSSGSAPQSPVESHKLRRFWTSATMPLPGSSIVSSVNGSSGDAIALTSPEPPVMIIFTMCGDKYAFLHLQLDRNVKVELQSCLNCINRKPNCSRVLIRSSSNKLASKRLIVRRLCAQQKNERGLDSWNLACFRYPQHPGFKNLELLSIKYLSLHFDTLDQRDEFCKEFESLENLRNRDLNEYEQTLRRTKYLSNNFRPH